jgi:RNA polymerase sigma-70 factor (ECF subfamily)
VGAPAGTSHVHRVLTPLPTSLEDAALLDRACLGDRNAFRVIYERHVAAIHGYLAARIGPQAADDVTSEAFAEAWAARAKFDPRLGSVRAWLYGIATKVLARHRERERRWLDGLLHDPPDTERVEDAPGIQLDLDLARALAALSPTLRDVLVLTAVADLRVADEARVLGISTVAARVRLHRARSIVAAALEESGHD